MAPVKFALFKSRSRDQEQPSTENLLQSSNSIDSVALPPSPVPSTSKDTLQTEVKEDDPYGDLAALQLDSDESDNISEHTTPTRRISDCIPVEEIQANNQLQNNQTSVSEQDNQTLVDDQEDAATSCDAMSLQFDQTSIAASEDVSVYCGTLKKTKKTKREEQLLSDSDMWRASNMEVMQHLLNRSGTLDEQIKWEAIATARGLCILKDSCTCNDCVCAKFLAGVTDGDGGLGAAPLFSAINFGCQVQ